MVSSMLVDKVQNITGMFYSWHPKTVRLLHFPLYGIVWDGFEVPRAGALLSFPSKKCRMYVFRLQVKLSRNEGCFSTYTRRCAKL